MLSNCDKYNSEYDEEEESDQDDEISDDSEELHDN
jgi:hypothetical protein